MSEETTKIDQAFELLGKVPMPDDAEEQLDELIKSAKGTEKAHLETLLEALFVQREDGAA